MPPISSLRTIRHPRPTRSFARSAVHASIPFRTPRSSPLSKLRGRARQFLIGADGARAVCSPCRVMRAVARPPNVRVQILQLCSCEGSRHGPSARGQDQTYHPGKARQAMTKIVWIIWLIYSLLSFILQDGLAYFWTDRCFEDVDYPQAPSTGLRINYFSASSFRSFSETVPMRASRSPSRRFGRWCQDSVMR